MNGKQTDVQIIRDMLKMGTATETSMQYRLGLEEEDFDRYRRHVLRRGFATETIDPTQDFILQPTPAGEALVHLIDTLESIDTRNQKKEHPLAKEQPPFVISHNMTAAMMLMRERMFQAYVLEQAEVTRLKAQLKYDGDDEELTKEYRQRQQKLNLLNEFHKVLAHLVDQPGNSWEENKGD